MASASTKARGRGAAAGRPPVGFIGVGLMGHGMAKNILAAGYPLAIMGHRNRKPVADLVKRGATEVKSAAALARRVEVLFLCVTSSVEVEGLVRGLDGILAGGSKGLVVVDCSTSDPTSTLALAKELKAKSIKLIDAPLGRSPKESEEGRLNAFVGADKATFRRLMPLFRTWAENVVHVGPVGAGHKIKLINNFISVTYAALYAEAFTACRATGVDPEIFRSVVEAGPMNNQFFQNVCKWVIGRDPKAHAFTIRNCAKDVGYYNRLVDAAGLTSVLGSAVKQSYALALAQGAGDRYMPMMADVVAELNGLEFVPEPTGGQRGTGS